MSDQPTPLRPSDRDWPEDFAHENGNYLCSCVGCGQAFMGYKRRVQCKKCATKADQPTQREGVERLMELVSGAFNDCECDTCNNIRTNLRSELTRLVKAVDALAAECAGSRAVDESDLIQYSDKMRELTVLRTATDANPTASAALKGKG